MSNIFKCRCCGLKKHWEYCCERDQGICLDCCVDNCEDSLEARKQSNQNEKREEKLRK